MKARDCSRKVRNTVKRVCKSEVAEEQKLSRAKHPCTCPYAHQCLMQRFFWTLIMTRINRSAVTSCVYAETLRLQRRLLLLFPPKLFL